MVNEVELKVGAGGRGLPRHGAPALHDELCVRLGSLQQLPESSVLLPVLVPFLLPRPDGLAVEDHDVEEGVEEKDGVGSYGRGVEHRRDRRTLQHKTSAEKKN